MKKQVDIAGLNIDNFSYDEVILRISDIIKSGKKEYMVTVNPEMVLNASVDGHFFDVLSEANILTPDGIGILWAAYYLIMPVKKNKIWKILQLFGSLFSVMFAPKKLRSVLKERVTGADLFPKIIDGSQVEGWKIFLLGSKKGVAKKAKSKLLKTYPKANIVDYYSGSPHPDEEKEICRLINNASPDILFVAYGSPNQELWIYRNIVKLEYIEYGRQPLVL